MIYSKPYVYRADGVWCVFSNSTFAWFDTWADAIAHALKLSESVSQP